MGPVEHTLFGFMVGLTACGLAGSAMELISGRRLAFVEPYVSPAHVLRSLVATACVGPLMFANEALDAWRQGRISAPALISCGCTATIWALALGVVLIDIASKAGILLGSADFFSVRRFGGEKCRSMRSTEKPPVSRTRTATGSRPTHS